MNDERGIGLSDVDSTVSEKIAAAENDVAQAGVAFSASLVEASQAGRETAARVVSIVRPVLIGVGLLAGAMLTIRLLGRSSRARGFRLSSGSPVRPLWSELSRSFAISLASVAGRRLAERWVGRGYS